MTVQAVTDATFETDVLKSEQIVVVDFWAEWCGPCRALAPVLEDLASEYGDQVKIVKMNIDENPDAPVQHGVRSIPTLMMFKGGEAIETQVGALPKPTLKEWIDRSL